MAGFDNRFRRSLPGEEPAEARPRQVQGVAWSAVMPEAVVQPRMLAWSEDMAAELGLNPHGEARDAWLAALAGNQLLSGMQPYAMCYGGHQFGHWAGQLGDGRAISLGEWKTESQSSWEMQLKGAGPTPYSRSADGRAVLRSSLREFVCSEAMHHLGVPTTRALSLVGTGETVVRDMFYDGNPQAEPGAVVCRLAPSFLRFGSFELAAARGDLDLLRRLVDYCVREHFPQHYQQGADVVAWFDEICVRTAQLMVQWQAVGFVHGVMNTDNMSIHGLTIDYGPYGWLEPYEPYWTPNTTDAQGRRYCFANQAPVAQWNLACLAQALAPLLSDIEPLKQALGHYAVEYQNKYRQVFAAKLGLAALEPDDALLHGFFACLQQQETDYCLSFRALAQLPTLDTSTPSFDKQALSVLEPALYAPLQNESREAWISWLNTYAQRLARDGLPADERRAAMRSVNPKYVPRNYLLQQAIEAAQLGDLAELHKLQRVLRKPYDEQPQYAAYAARRPEWARHKAGCSALSCSS